MAALTRTKGREIVAKLRSKNGGISDEQRRKLDPEVLAAFDERGRMLGKQLVGLVEDLYSKDTHFAFELIQNADDNKYTKAEQEGEDPFLAFALHPDRIVVDSNEDGFEPENVRAICTARDSSKTTSGGYIGEKGIGFKSLFRVASKVHIQSGPFSFYFKHLRDDDGMGLITPMDEDYLQLPPNVRTRMILTLSEPAKFKSHADVFSEPLLTVLMFLNKLKKLIVAKYDTSHLLSTETLLYQYAAAPYRGTLTRLMDYNNGTKPESTVSFYHVAKQVFFNLPKDHRRTYKKKDEICHINRAEVVLAFPLDANSLPLLEMQDVYAFLPMKSAGFNFLIQSDFITIANRGDLAEDNAWNLVLLDNVAHTFVNAVLQFCRHSTLQFQWMRYLPSNKIPGRFWAQLLPRIVNLLKEKPIVRPRSGGPLKRPQQLRWMSREVDANGDPLFEDLPEERYLSQYYKWRDFQDLTQLGTRVINMSEILARVRADLLRPTSKMKSAATNDDWHSRSAKLLLEPFDNDRKMEADQIWALELIPLQGGRWDSGNSGLIRNPYNDTIPVPTDLGLKLLEEKALGNPDRKALFSKLGVKDCRPKKVIERIIERYSSN